MGAVGSAPGLQRKPNKPCPRTRRARRIREGMEISNENDSYTGVTHDATLSPTSGKERYDISSDCEACVTVPATATPPAEELASPGKGDEELTKVLQQPVARFAATAASTPAPGVYMMYDGKKVLIEDLGYSLDEPMCRITLDGKVKWIAQRGFSPLPSTMKDGVLQETG